MVIVVRISNPLLGRRLLALILIPFLLSACAAQIPQSAPVPPTSTQHRKSALTEKEYAFARELVRSEVRKEGAVLTSATVTVGYGKVFDSNIGYPCTSGRLLHIKLIGDFPHIVVGRHPKQPGETTLDLIVRAVNLTADAETGRACLLGVQTGKVAPASGAESLPIN